ncbi:MAG: hypothetical protein OET79_00210 [Nitrospirota bacterium]|nr:hypothetical protein [Nitrospirota bacterium]
MSNLLDFCPKGSSRHEKECRESQAIWQEVFLVKIKKGPMNEGRFFIEEVVSEAYKKRVFFIPNSLFLTFHEISLSFSQKNMAGMAFEKPYLP